MYSGFGLTGFRLYSEKIRKIETFDFFSRPISSLKSASPSKPMFRNWPSSISREIRGWVYMGRENFNKILKCWSTQMSFRKTATSEFTKIKLFSFCLGPF